MSSGRGDIFGRIIGMLVFLLGVGLLIFVFRYAYTLFTMTPDSALGLRFTSDPKTSPNATVIGTRFGFLLLRMGFLFVMSIAGSLISQKGINLYFSALHGFAMNLARHQPQPAPNPSATPNA